MKRESLLDASEQRMTDDEIAGRFGRRIGFVARLAACGIRELASQAGGCD